MSADRRKDSNIALQSSVLESGLTFYDEKENGHKEYSIEENETESPIKYVGDEWHAVL